MGWDLLLNLVSEIVGIAITVFLVDKLIQKREDARWLPSKQFLYSRLIVRFDSILHVSAPFVMLGTSYIYQFGEAVATTLEIHIEFTNSEAREEFRLKVKRFSDALSVNSRIEILKILVQEKDEIDKMLASSIAVIEPELSSLLMKLQRVLGDAKTMAETMHFERFEQALLPSNLKSEFDLFSMFIYSVAEAAQNSKVWVVGKATKRRSVDEFKLELIAKAQQQKEHRRDNG